MASRWSSSCFRILWHWPCLFLCCALYPNLGIVPGEGCEPTCLKSWSCFILINFRAGMSSATLRRYLQRPTHPRAGEAKSWIACSPESSLSPSPFSTTSQMSLLSLFLVTGYVYGLWVRKISVQIPALPLAGCVTVGEFLKLPEAQSSYLELSRLLLHSSQVVGMEGDHLYKAPPRVGNKL